jgi:hypothetical protein
MTLYDGHICLTIAETPSLVSPAWWLYILYRLFSVLSNLQLQTSRGVQAAWFSKANQLSTACAICSLLVPAHSRSLIVSPRTLLELLELLFPLLFPLLDPLPLEPTHAWSQASRTSLPPAPSRNSCRR